MNKENQGIEIKVKQPNIFKRIYFKLFGNKDFNEDSLETVEIERRQTDDEISVLNLEFFRCPKGNNNTALGELSGYSISVGEHNISIPQTDKGWEWTVKKELKK